MISFIQGPYEDETLPSLLARLYGGISGPTRSQFAQHLFGNPRMVIPFDFPCAIDALERAIGKRVGIFAEQFIQNHTMFPIPAFFMPPEQAEKVKGAMRADRAVAMNLIKWHRDPAQDGLRHLNFCPICRGKDLEEFQLTWWRRIHQVPGVINCAIHDVPLEVSQFALGQFWAFDYPDPNQAVRIRTAPRPDGIDLVYARDVRWMLSNTPHHIDPARLKVLYRERLEARGLLLNGRLRRTEFLHSFYDQRTKHAWEQRHLLFNPDDASAWPAQTVMTNANHRSFRMHLLVMRFLDLSIAEIGAKLAAVQLDAVDRTRKSDAVLQEELRKVWFDKSWSMEAIKRHLQIGVIRTNILAHKAGLPFPRLPSARRLQEFKKLLRERRKIVRKGKDRTSPGKWRAAIRWLYRNDRTWARDHLDLKIGRRKTPVDWPSRETRYLEMLPSVAARIRAARPFRRLCRSSFISLLPFGTSLNFRLKKHLPKLKDEIDRLSEKGTQFTLRRIKVIRQVDPGLHPYEVRERASVSRNCRDPEVLKAMGYVLVGKRWQVPGGADHPLYGLSVAVGPAANQP